MPTTYADLERMYDGPIPREELARCAEMAPRYTVSPREESLRVSVTDLIERLDETAKRLRSAILATGTDPEFADIAVQEAQAACRRARAILAS